MKRALVFGIVGLFLVSATGCGASGPDGLMKEQIRLMNEMADAMEKKDEAKLKDVEAKMKANAEKLENLKLSDEEKKKLVEKYKGELQAAGERMAKAMFGQMGDQLGDMMNKMKQP